MYTTSRLSTATSWSIQILSSSALLSRNPVVFLTERPKSPITISQSILRHDFQVRVLCSTDRSHCSCWQQHVSVTQILHFPRWRHCVVEYCCRYGPLYLGNGLLLGHARVPRARRGCRECFRRCVTLLHWVLHNSGGTKRKIITALGTSKDNPKEPQHTTIRNRLGRLLSSNHSPQVEMESSHYAFLKGAGFELDWSDCRSNSLVGHFLR